ncbi:MAG: hypothetical protein AB199_03290 [Parcubacteria bacterium C7867-004]|nr:MAG: hypothetical protein AB199_03290 [Parcubacteria bacterium C7867-004]
MTGTLKPLIGIALATRNFTSAMVDEIMSHPEYSPLTVARAICEQYLDLNDLEEVLFGRMLAHPSFTIEDALAVADYAIRFEESGGMTTIPLLWWNGDDVTGGHHNVIARLMKALSPEEQRKLILKQIYVWTDPKTGSWKIAKLLSYATPSASEHAQLLIDLMVRVELAELPQLAHVNQLQWLALLAAVTRLEAPEA